MIAAIIIGRKGSTGFPGKNSHTVLGRLLCEYPLLAAKHSTLVDKLYVSTDDEVIRQISKKYGAIEIARPPELATNEALGEDVFRYAYTVIRDSLADGEKVEQLVLLMCNSATILGTTIDEGIGVLRKNPTYDSAVTVSRYNMWSPLRARTEGPDGLLQPFVPFSTFGDPDNLNCDRDSQGDVWFADMGVSIVRPACLENLEGGLLPMKWMGQNIYPLKQWGGCDIDYEWQVPGVEFWLRRHGFTDSQTPYV